MGTFYFYGTRVSGGVALLGVLIRVSRATASESAEKQCCPAN